MFRITISDSFAAAISLPGFVGSCANLHGHTYVVKAVIGSDTLDEHGMVIDHHIIQVKLREILQEYDHSHLNRLDCFKKINPTSENIAKIIYERLYNSFDNNVFTICEVMISEKPNVTVSYKK